MSDMELESLEGDAEENIDELETVDKQIWSYESSPRQPVYKKNRLLDRIF